MLIPLLTITLGVWLTLAPDILQYAWRDAGFFDRIVGPVLIAFATVCLWELMGPLRWACVLVGCVLVSSPIWLSDAPISSTVVHLITGLLVVGLNLLTRRRKHRYGGGWRSLVKRDSSWNKITWS